MDQMSYNFTQTDMANPETQYFYSTHLNPYAEVHLKFPYPDSAYLNPSRFYMFRTNEDILKLHKSKLVRMKFPIQVTILNYILPSLVSAKLSFIYFYLNIAQLRPQPSQLKNKKTITFKALDID